MAITDAFVLPPDTMLQPVSELAAARRREIGSGDGDFALTRPNSRAHSKVVDTETAALLRQFEKPSTIPQAVARFSRGKAASAEALLEQALPLLQSLIADQLLVAADSPGATRLRASFAEEGSVDGWAILECVQTQEDTEVFRARGPAGQLAALKIARPGADAAGRTIVREAGILRKLDAIVTPRLYGTGEWMGRSYLLMEWCAGPTPGRLAPSSANEATRSPVSICSVSRARFSKHMPVCTNREWPTATSTRATYRSTVMAR